MMNRALLAHHYEIRDWSIPKGYLCPPVPGRADYIHYLADLIEGKREARVLDVGTGANCIYPLIGHQSYGWKFVGSEIDSRAIESAEKIIEANPSLEVEIILQENDHAFFQGIINRSDHFHLTMCNPPFYMNAQEAAQHNRRKVINLKGKKAPRNRNFGGQAKELWCQGGELRFISQMIEESAQFRNQVGWFTCLVSKGEHLAPLKKKLAGIGTRETRIVDMAQGQKRSRFIAWRF